MINGTLAEIRKFNGPINAASTYVHYSEGFIVAPGFIDLSELLFTTTDDKNGEDVPFHTDDDEDDDDFAVAPTEDDDYATATTTTSTVAANNGGRHSRKLEDIDPRSPAVDIVLFHEPTQCSNSAVGCDWTQLGVGASDGAGDLRWCCSSDAIELGMCSNGMYGRLIVDKVKFHGQHHFFMVPPYGPVAKTLAEDQQIFDVKNDSGKYVMIVANCDDYGRNLTVSGRFTWKSKHGYLPGDLIGEMYFFLIVMVFYLILFGIYGFAMYFHRQATIPIQKWILFTIGLGFVETFFKTGDYFVWNISGNRFWYAMYMGVVVGALKRGISRCLIVMVSNGWGVSRDTLSQMWKIVGMGILYIVISGTSDIMTDVAIADYKTLSVDTEEKLFDVITILTFFVAVIDATFYMWIFDSLSSTMENLEATQQTRKLLRYLRLRCLLLLSILFAVVWAVFSLVSKIMATPILKENQDWAVRSAWELNYLVVLVGVAVLWMPNPQAKDYAFVMELPPLGNEVDFDTNTGTVGDDDDENGGYKDSPQANDDELDFAREKA